jgi:4-hydroxybenzoate polyprenyltransferase
MVKSHMVQDIKEQSLWDRLPFLKPYALLARWDRPIGFWLLFWPCLWGMALAPTFKDLSDIRRIEFVIMFLIGAVAMRGAGCTINDLLDRKLDAQVERTKARPLASGQLKPWQAIAFLMVQLGAGAAVLFQLSPLAIMLGLATLPLIAIYPLMKRFIWGPQFFLALNFAAGALIGWAAIENILTWPALVLYAAGMCWVVAYDTVYAHMDTQDDSLIGIKSTALWWGPESKKIIGWLWMLTLILFTLVLNTMGAIWVSYVMVGLAALILFTAHIFWNPDNSAYSLRFFRLQHQIGMILALAALAPVLF